MSEMFWKVSGEDEMHRAIILQDESFQRAMRQELRELAAEKGIALNERPLPTAPRPPKPRDVINIVTSMPSEAMPLYKRIMREICQKHQVTMVNLLSDRRARHIVAARYEAMYRMSEEAGMSLPAIGRRFNKDHTTCLYGIRKYKMEMGIE